MSRSSPGRLGAAWAGDTHPTTPPEPLDANHRYYAGLETGGGSLEKPGTGAGGLVINAIRKESVDQDYLSKLDYPRDLWMEKEIKSVGQRHPVPM